MKLLSLLLAVLAFPSTAAAGKAFDQDEVTGRELIAFLDHDSWRYRNDACEELADRRIVQAADKMVELAARDPSDRVRRACLEALDDLDSDKLVPAAETMALGDPDDGNRRSALAQIEDHGNERSAPVLARVLLSDADADTRRKAAVILGKKNWRAGFDAIRAAAIQDANDDVRIAAVDALGRHPGADDRDALVTCLDDRDEHVQRRAARALVTLGDRSVAPLLRDKALDAKDADVAEEFNEAAERLGG